MIHTYIYNVYFFFFIFLGGGGGALANGGKITMVRDLQLQANCAEVDGGREDISLTYVQVI